MAYVAVGLVSRLRALALPPSDRAAPPPAPTITPALPAGSAGRGLLALAIGGAVIGGGYLLWRRRRRR